MFNLGTYFFIAIIACNLYGLQTKYLDRDFPESVMNTPANQLWVKMLPFFITLPRRANAISQETSRKSNQQCRVSLKFSRYILRKIYKNYNSSEDNQGRLSRIESQQTEIQENLKYLLEILRNNIPENFEERLVRMEEQQTSLREILKKIPLDIAERLGRMEDQQKSLGAQLEAQINAEKEQKSQLEGFKKTIPENFEERLTKMEVQQTSLQEALRRIPEDLEGRMDRMERHETDIQKDIQTSTTRHPFPQFYKDRSAAD